MKHSFNLEHLHYFVTVAEQGSITRAARILKRDRTTVSMAIANLEVDIGFDLLNRQGRRIELTREGEEFFRQARALVQHHQSFYHYSVKMNAGVEQQLTICHDWLLSNAEIQVVDKAVYQEFPNTLVNWLPATGPDQLDLLADGQADLAITVFQNQDLSESVQIRHLSDMSFVPVCNAAVTGLESPELRFEQLRLLPMLKLPEIEKVIRLDRISRVQQVSSIDMALALLDSKPSWSLLPVSALEGRHEHLVQLRTPTISDIRARRILRWSQESEQGQVKRWLINQLQTLF